MKKIWVTACFASASLLLTAQEAVPGAVNRFLDFSAAAGQSQGTAALSFINNWRIGRKRKWEAGVGLRYTGYAGRDRDFITAPGRYSRSTTTPFLIVLSGQETQNWDTLTVFHPLVHVINLSANFGYAFSQSFSAGFNIDLIGFSFGKSKDAVLAGDGKLQTEPSAKPTAFNLLLTGDNDRGSLNSEFFLKYALSPRIAVKAVYQFYFAEYTTGSVYQQEADGGRVYRFRNKVNAFGAGLSYHFNRQHAGRH
jgi:hypothetical protein